MSYPNLSMRRVRRHPAVIKNASDLQPGMDVALCHLMKPIQKIVGFENLGLAEDPYKLNQFVVNLSALPEVKT